MSANRPGSVAGILRDVSRWLDMSDDVLKNFVLRYEDGSTFPFPVHGDEVQVDLRRLATVLDRLPCRGFSVVSGSFCRGAGDGVR